MSTLRIPSILIDLGHVGGNGLPVNSAAWFQKELELCREWGFRLNVSEERVSLEYDQDQLVPDWIQKETPAIAWDWLRVNGFLSVPSTNNEALEMARRGAPAGTLIVAEEQTAGKGRNGRSWVSNARRGLYFTVILRPLQPLPTWPLLTHVASLSLVETLKELVSLQVFAPPLDIDLKWPNDVLISGKKCAGILLESTAEGSGNAAVVGVGINIRHGSVPESLASSAVCLDEMAHTVVPRRQVLVCFLKNFQKCYLIFERGNHGELLSRWKRSSSMWDDTPVWVTVGGARLSAVTCGLNEIGALMVRTEEGKVQTLVAGDVSIRKAGET